MTLQGELSTLVSFAQTNGATPSGGLTWGPDGALYGTTESGGAAGQGTVFKVTTNGVLTTLASFDYLQGVGGWPLGGLVQGGDGAFYGATFDGMFRVATNGALSQVASFAPFNTNGINPLVAGRDGAFYCTTPWGGDWNDGMVLRVTTNGEVTTLASLDYTNGAYPCGGLVVGADGAFYGAAGYGGDQNDGTVFRVTTNGVLTTVLSFDDESAWGPLTGLLKGNDGLFYGIACGVGSHWGGAVFQVTTTGELQVLALLDTASWGWATPPLMQGNDGALYGVLDGGGVNNSGSIFRVTTHGEPSTLFSFTNTEGVDPRGGLVLAGDGAFYGSTTKGGSNNCGMVYRLTTNGVVMPVASFDWRNGNGRGPLGGFIMGNDGALYGANDVGVLRVTTNGSVTMLATFSFDGPEGVFSGAALTLGSDGVLYGTTQGGGSNGHGAIFRCTTNGTLTSLGAFSEANGIVSQTPLVQDRDGAFYGATSYSLSAGTNSVMPFGTVFRVTTNGELSTVFAFTFDFFRSSPFRSTTPCLGLTVGADGALYGTAGGVVFRLTTDGAFTGLLPSYGSESSLLKGPDHALYGAYCTNGVVVEFQIATNGVAGLVDTVSLPNQATLSGGLALGPDGYLYGVASTGGTRGGGDIFRVRLGDPVSPPPPPPPCPPRMQSVSFLCGDWVAVSFWGDSGQTYSVLKATNLCGPWVTLGQATAGSNGVAVFGEWARGQRAAFYRATYP